VSASTVPQRGRGTFTALAEFPARGKPAELVIPYSVPDIADIVVSINSRPAGDSAS
jgi:hypothetical protein